ncbi:hypothetical protein [Methylocaldum sp.]|uniref:hypothetical protein n=1 Tax=Methylocaldum sp. TaxID=1969727 RepID=UPI002D55F18B|nr:hypothetical protein [Methylocaldum sp.]HYE35529.1 hypothetical protein [Methylocaldum sp.]
MELWIWLPVLAAGVWAAHWGADQLAEPLKKLCQQWGLSSAAEAAFAGIAAASLEVAMATASVLRDVAPIGLGATLGTNIMAIPLVVTTAYMATHLSRAVGCGNEGRVATKATVCDWKGCD